MLPATAPSLQGQLRGHEEFMPKQIQTRREVRNRGEHKVTLVAEFASFWDMASEVIRRGLYATARDSLSTIESMTG